MDQLQTPNPQIVGPFVASLPLPEFLKVEQARNIAATKTFHRFLHRAVGKCDIMVAHHITWETEGSEPNELPSADTLLFNPTLMVRVFGETKAPMVMSMLVKRPPELRELVLGEYLDALDAEDPAGAL